MDALRRCVLAGLLLFLTSGCDAIALLHGTAPPRPESCVRGDYQLIGTDRQAPTPEILAQTRTIIENRMNATGLVAPVVRSREPDTITVTFPTSGSDAEIRTLVGTTGVLEFIPVPEAFSNAVTQGEPLPPDMPATPIFGGDQIAAARPGQTQTGLSAVDIELKSEGARLFDEYAAGHQGERFAIVLDGIVQSAPTINAPSFGGQMQISGSLTSAQVNMLVTVLRYGSLPVQITEVGFVTVSCADAGL